MLTVKEDKMDTEKQLAEIGPRDTAKFRDFCAQYGVGPWFVENWGEYAALSNAGTIVYGHTILSCRERLGDANEWKANYDRRAKIEEAKIRG
jgi:hypothetical protein